MILTFTVKYYFMFKVEIDSLNEMLQKMNISVFNVIKTTNTEFYIILNLPYFYSEVFSNK